MHLVWIPGAIKRGTHDRAAGVPLALVISDSDALGGGGGMECHSFRKLGLTGRRQNWENNHTLTHRLGGFYGNIYLQHTQQRLPQVLKPRMEYATFADVEGPERPPILLIQEGPPRTWRYRKQGLHGPEMGARRWGNLA